MLPQNKIQKSIQPVLNFVRHGLQVVHVWSPSVFSRPLGQDMKSRHLILEPLSPWKPRGHRNFQVSIFHHFCYSFSKQCFGPDTSIFQVFQRRPNYSKTVSGFLDPQVTSWKQISGSRQLSAIVIFHKSFIKSIGQNTNSSWSFHCLEPKNVSWGTAHPPFANLRWPTLWLIVEKKLTGSRTWKEMVWSSFSQKKQYFEQARHLWTNTTQNI